MARTREYDEQQVREGAMGAFLRKGFGQTSLVDLETATGLNRRQLYNDFGDKRAVFLQALEDFCVAAGERVLHPLEGSEPRLDAIEATLFGMIDLAETPFGRLGCLICNTSREPIAQEPEVRGVVDRFFRRIENGYRNALRNAQAAGELPETEDVDRLARFFLGAHVAVCVLGRAGEDLSTLRDVATEAVQRVR